MDHRKRFKLTEDRYDERFAWSDYVMRLETGAEKNDGLDDIMSVDGLPLTLKTRKLVDISRTELEKYCGRQGLSGAELVQDLTKE